MQQHRPIKPCKAAKWDDKNNRWNIPAGDGFIKRSQKKIRKRSVKGARTDRVYSQRRKWFLSMPENQKCPVALAGLLPGQRGHIYPHHLQTSQIHHMRGRVGMNFLDESSWIAVSALGHQWIHANVAEARKRGWIESRA